MLIIRSKKYLFPNSRLKDLQNLTHQPVFRFLLLSFIYFILWDLIIYNYIIPIAFQYAVISWIGNISKMCISWFFENSQFIKDTLYINYKACVHIGIPCNGVETMGIISCVILAYHAHWKEKLWFISFNIAVIFLLNCLRIIVLALLLFKNQHSFDINHKYLFNILLYGLLLIIFALWNRKLNRHVK